MRSAFLTLVLLCTSACQSVALSTHFDFEGDPVGAAPIALDSPGAGWSARVETGQAASGLRSVRVYAQQDPERGRFGDLSFKVDATAFRGKVVRVSGSLRVENGALTGSSMRLFLDVERSGGGTALHDEMVEVPVQSAEWMPVEIVGAVAADASTITFGTRVSGQGPFHLDDLALEVVHKMGPGDPPLLTSASARQLANPDVQVVHLRSELLSRFFGRDMFVDAGVIVPPAPLSGEMAACYQIADSDASWTRVYSDGAAIACAMREQYPRMLYVYLDGSSPQGHHAFADSVNDGPWGEALVNELIPAIESKFLAGRGPRCRYVTGHGSGGWSALWLQTAYPHFFNGAWATAPDAVGFRDFEGTDIYGPGSRRVSNELPRVPMARLESQFSPRGNDGRPMPLFDKSTGSVDPVVAQAWRKYDIDAILCERWETLGSKLSGRLHVWCGASDTPGRVASVRTLEQDLARLGARADVRIIADRDHGNLADPHTIWWPLGISTRIHREMTARTAAIARP